MFSVNRNFVFFFVAAMLLAVGIIVDSQFKSESVEQHPRSITIDTVLGGSSVVRASDSNKFIVRDEISAWREYYRQQIDKGLEDRQAQEILKIAISDQLASSLLMELEEYCDEQGFFQTSPEILETIEVAYENLQQQGENIWEELTGASFERKRSPEFSELTDVYEAALLVPDSIPIKPNEMLSLFSLDRDFSPRQGELSHKDIDEYWISVIGILGDERGEALRLFETPPGSDDG